MKYPLRIAVIGLGGFAGSHHLAIRQLEQKGIFRLVCTCDPDPEAFSDKQSELGLSDRKVQVFDDYQRMLRECGSELDLITVPTPIPLHAPMHRAGVEHGLAVYLEKPPTLDYAELETMIETDRQARHQTMVGFNYIVDPERQKLKQRLAAGEFGPVNSVSVYALWPRGRDYYQRARWAGRLQLDNQLVLDSCIGNAAAHLVHNVLFWSGCESLFQWGQPDETQAEMYRAHPIQGADTVFVKSRTTTGIELRIGMSHACTGRTRQEETIACEKAILHYHINQAGPDQSAYTIQYRDGTTESGPVGGSSFLPMNLTAYAEYLLGQRERPLTTLEDSRPFVHINNLAYLAAGTITPFPESAVKTDENGYLEVAEVPESIVDFVSSGRLPKQQVRPWAAASGISAKPEDLPRLPAVIAAMAEPDGQ